MTELEDSMMIKVNESTLAQKRVTSLEGKMAGTQQEIVALRHKYLELEEQRGTGDKLAAAMHSQELKKLEAEILVMKEKTASTAGQAMKIEQACMQREMECDRSLQRMTESHGLAMEMEKQAFVQLVAKLKGDISQLQKELAHLKGDQMERQALYDSALARATELEDDNARIMDEKQAIIHKATMNLNN
jgi:hypothetical protein